jgi:hypothetical protein
MKTSIRPDHHTLANALQRRVLEGPGKTPPELRQSSAEWAARGSAGKTPCADLARQIGEASHMVTDAQVSSVVVATGGEKAAFEIVTAAAVGAGLFRWRQAMKALDEATNASA